MSKKRVLKKNFYFTNDGGIVFRQMIRGDLIAGRTGMTDPRKVNKNASQIKHRIISEYYQLKKQKEKRPNFIFLKDKWLKRYKNYPKSTYNTYKYNVETYLKNFEFPDNISKSRENAIRRDMNIFLRWCRRQGYKVDILKCATESEGRLRVLSEDELNNLFSIIKPIDLKDCFMFAYLTGSRRKEINAPKIEWLRQNNKGQYYLQVIKKGGYKRIIRINNDALNILKERNFVFWDYSTSWLTRRMSYYSKKANINDVIFHDLRRTFGYNLLVKGHDIAIVARLLGISIKVAEKHYTPLLTADIGDFTLY